MTRTSPGVGSTPEADRRARRELYIDAFRGLMALLMVQGHSFDTLLMPGIRGDPLYRLQQIFHGSTAPGFLFASGFVAGLPRAPLSPRASLRRARRLLFVLLVGYALHLPYLSFWKLLLASPAEKAVAASCDALQVIAVSQLFVLLLQWIAGRRWVRLAGILTIAILAVTPFVFIASLSLHMPLLLGAYVDSARAPSTFPAFPFSAFVLAGTVAGAAIGRQEARTRHRRSLLWGGGLLALGFALAFPLQGRVEFWGPSPAYALMRLGGLLLILRIVESACLLGLPGTRSLALLGHETLLVYVLHLYWLYGGLVGAPPLGHWAGQLALPGAWLTLGGMVVLLLAAAAAWHRLKVAAPHEGTLILAFLTSVFLFEFFTRPW